MPLLAPAFAYNFDLSIYGDFFVGGGVGQDFIHQTRCQHNIKWKFQ